MAAFLAGRLPALFLARFSLSSSLTAPRIADRVCFGGLATRFCCGWRSCQALKLFPLISRARLKLSAIISRNWSDTLSVLGCHWAWYLELWEAGAIVRL